MATTKVKLSDFAADVNVPVQELIDQLRTMDEKAKKPTSSLSNSEMNYLLEYYSQKNQVETFDEYFADRQNGQHAEGAQKPTRNVKPEKVSRDKKPEKKSEPQKQNKKEQGKNEQVKKEQPEKNKAAQPAEKPVKKENTPQAEVQAPKPETAEKPQEQAKPAEAAAETPAQEPPKPRVLTAAEIERRAREHAAMYEKQHAEKKARHQKNAQKNQKNEQSGGKNQKANEQKKGQPEQKKQQQNAPVKQNETAVNNKKNEAPAMKQNTAPRNPVPKTPKKPAKAQERGEILKMEGNFAVATEVQPSQQRHTIDTRGSYFDLDKYNERYEQIAPQGRGGKHDGLSAKKQKINQKSQQRKQQAHSSKAKETETERLRRLELERARKQQLKVMIPDSIVISELAARLKVQAKDVIKKLIPLGIMASLNEEIDFDTASLVAEELGAKVEHEVIVTIEERLITDEEDPTDALEERCPVVVVMGHVDHGKTSILDRIRNANVTASEAGGITQHIGAYQVKHEGKVITFLDTPGHEAFTSMRARGANITDIAILVVAADDGIMPQTIESINHAKAAGITIIVAINKMDKEGANPDRIKQQLTEYELVCEEWGGDVICVPVSAKTGEGIPELLENILLVSEVMELKANPNRKAKGTVIEARLDKGRGPIATILVQNGTLHTGDVIIAGTAVGRVRVMTNYKGKVVKEAGPSVPVEITGLAEVPSAGDIFNAVEDERLAKELVEQRKHEAKEEQFKNYRKVTLDNLFSQIAEGEMKELPLIVKADVQGSVEAVTQSLEKLTNEEVRVRVIHGAVGAVSESDVMLASASNAIIVGFNVRPMPIAMDAAARDGVDIRLYRIIYDAIEEISTAMKGMLAPKYRDVEMGQIEVRQVYRISSVGTVAGCYVTSGKVTRQCQIRVVRDGIVVAEDKIDSLRRFKDDVKEVATGYECGISLERFADIKEGDVLEAFIIEEYREE
ncbi:MAG: translation initiation factor IF-2 [Oscillospiraceae bacterium]|nr:translation initiation factor IF-2 [Oscillospiraceae bacterium]